MKIRYALISVALALNLMGATCMFGSPDPEALASQARIVADAEQVYTVAAKTAAQVIHCDEPTYIPCAAIGGPPSAEVQGKIRALDNAAHAALVNVRAKVTAGQDATGYIAILGTAIVAFTAYTSTPQFAAAREKR
jgi:hypothetical protein